MFYQSSQYISHVIIFRVAFSIRFRFLIGTKTVLEEVIRIQQVILKAMKQPRVANLSPLFCKLKVLCRTGRLI